MCLLAVGLYAVAFVFSATTMKVKDKSNQETATAQVYFNRLLGQLDAASRQSRQVAVLNAAVPAGIVAPIFAPWNQLLYTLPVVRPDAAVDQLREANFDVASNGALMRIRFQRTSGSSLGLPIASVNGTPGAASTAKPAAVADGSCFTSTRPGGAIDVRLVSPVSTPGAWLLVGLAAPSGGSVTVATLSNGQPALVGTIDLAAGSRTDDYLLPLSQRSFGQVELSAAMAGDVLCVSSIDVGTFSPSGSGR